MKFLTDIECKDWCKNHSISISSEEVPEINKDGFQTVEISYPIYTQFFYLSSLLSSNSLCDSESLLWITQIEIWKSGENLHLYYKLRQSYSDATLIKDKPGHLFLKHELEDLKSFLYLSLLFGWDCYLISSNDLLRVFFSHDEFIQLSSKDSELIKNINNYFTKK